MIDQNFSLTSGHRIFLFPCGYDKTPRVKHWREQSSSDSERINEWAKTNGFVPAIDCGKSNLIVVDVDCHDGSANGLPLWSELVETNGLPSNTPVVRTPSGGLHVYFSRAENECFGNREGEFSGKAINIRGDGGYVIAPGAILPDGRGWIYAEGSPDVFRAKPPPLPDWIATKIRPKQKEPVGLSAHADNTSDYGEAALSEICKEVEATNPGGQSNKLVHAATRIGSLVAGGEIEAGYAKARLIQAGLKMPNGNPHKPWTRSAVEDQVTRAFDVGLRSPDNAPARNLAAIDLSKISVGGKPLAFGASGIHAYRYRLLDVAELGSLPQLEWLIKGVFPARGVCAIYGASGSGKSFLALSCALAIANGSEWFGYRVKSAFVVYVALEGEAGFNVRIAALQTTSEKPIPDAFRLVLNQSFNLTAQNDLADLAAAIMAIGRANPVIFIDTFNRAAPSLDENSSKDMGAILQGIKALQSLTGGIVIFVHHSGKDAAKGLRGHSSLFAALDGAIEVLRNGDSRAFRVAKSKDGIDGSERAFRLEVVPLGIDVDGDEISSCVVVASDTGESGKPRYQLKGANKIAYNALSECRHTAIKTPQTILETFPTNRGKPLFPPLYVIPEAVWRDHCYANGISTGDQDAKKKAFGRARKALLELGLVHGGGGYFWPVNWCEQQLSTSAE